MKCPTCKKEIEYKDNPYRPFCSERCKLQDLAKWADGDYRVGGEKISDPHESEKLKEKS